VARPWNAVLITKISTASIVEMKALAATAALSSPVIAGDEKRSKAQKLPVLPGNKISASDRICVTQCVDALYDVLEIMGMNSRKGKGSISRKVKDSYDHTVQHWLVNLQNAPPGSWMSLAKYKFAAFFHTYSGALNEGPPKPEFVQDDNPGILASGIVGKFMKVLLRDPSKRSTLLSTISQLKKGCPRPSKEMVEVQVKKSVAALTKIQRSVYDPINLEDHFEPITAWADIQDLDPRIETVLSRESMCRQLERTVEELFVGVVYGDKDRYKPILPSTKATFAHSIKKGGNVTFIKKLVTEMGLNTDGGMKKGSQAGESLLKFNLKEERIDYAWAQEEKVFECDFKTLESRYRTLYNGAFVRAIDDEFDVKPIGLAESLKIRVITKGSGYGGFTLKPLQKFLHTHLRKHSTFALIGQPVDREYVQSRLGKNLPANQAYLSGDYSAATDNLAPWVSDCIARAIARVCRLTAAETDLFVKSLTGHVFVGEDGVKAKQLWGQLMGSVTSFPVLCIANAAMCRWAIELDLNKVRLLRDTTLMVNGDDCLFRTGKNGLNVWKVITSYGGLTPSVGKYFYSRLFAQINSLNYTHLDVPEVVQKDGFDKTYWFKQSEYINLGLLYGMKRSGEKLGRDAVTDNKDGLGARCHDLIKSAPYEYRSALMERFIFQHSRILKSCRVPWFIPQSWGGVGLPIVFSDEELQYQEVFGELPFKCRYYPSDKDLRVAHVIKTEPAKYPVRKAPPLGLWGMHKTALTRLPESKIMYASEDEEKEYDRLYAGLIVDSIFTGGDLMTDEKSVAKVQLAVLNRNSRSWHDALHAKGGLPAPLSIQTLMNSTQLKPIVLVSILSFFDTHIEDISGLGEAWDNFVAVDEGW